MKKLIVAVIFVVFLGVASQAQAKLLPRYSRIAKPVTSSGGTKPVVSAKFMSGKTGLRVSFSNLATASSVNYMLSYDSNGKSEGIVGSVKPSEGSGSRDLLFGTCSSGKCVYHKNIKNCVLTVTSQLKNGKKLTKKFNVKV